MDSTSESSSSSALPFFHSRSIARSSIYFTATYYHNARSRPDVPAFFGGGRVWYDASKRARVPNKGFENFLTITQHKYWPPMEADVRIRYEFDGRPGFSGSVHRRGAVRSAAGGGDIIRPPANCQCRVLCGPCTWRLPANRARAAGGARAGDGSGRPAKLGAAALRLLLAFCRWNVAPGHPTGGNGARDSAPWRGSQRGFHSRGSAG